MRTIRILFGLAFVSAGSVLIWVLAGPGIGAVFAGLFAAIGCWPLSQYIRSGS